MDQSADDIAARVAAASSLLARWVDTGAAQASPSQTQHGRAPPSDGLQQQAPDWAGSTRGVPSFLPSAPRGAPGFLDSRTPAGGPSTAFIQQSFGDTRPLHAPAASDALVQPLSRTFAVPPAQHAADMLARGVTGSPLSNFDAVLRTPASTASHHYHQQLLPPVPPLPVLLGAPPAAVAAALLGEDPTGPMEAACAAALNLLHTSPADAPAALEAACRRCADAARSAARGHLHRGGPLVAALWAQADALDSEAATWALVDHLLGRARLVDQQAADAEAVSTATAPLGGCLSARARAAARGRLVAPSPRDGPSYADAADVDDVHSVARMAAIVAWLESLAGVHLERSLGGEESSLSAIHGGADVPGLLSRFAPGDGAWTETRRAVAQQTTSGGGAGGLLVTELDFDAPSRSGKQLHPANVDDESRLHAACFALLRAGRLPACQALCCAVGQPWRAASYGAAAGFGPAAVGRAATEQLGEEKRQMERFATGSDMNDDTDELSCCPTSQLAAELDGPGSVAARCLWKWACAAAAMAASTSGAPAEAACYAVLAGDVAKVLPACASDDWHARAWARARGALDAAVDAALAGHAVGEPGLPLSGGSGPVDGPRWPTASALSALPSDLASCLDEVALSPTCGAAVIHRGIQRLLALGRWQELADLLDVWALPQGDDDSATASGPPPPGPLRCACHLLLVLRALAPQGKRQALFAPGQHLCIATDRLAVEYAHLLAAHQRLSLVPVYAAAVSASVQRLPLMLRFWQVLAPEPLALRRRCFDDALACLGMHDAQGRGAVSDLLLRLAESCRAHAIVADSVSAPTIASALGPAASALTSCSDRMRALEWAAFGGETTEQLTADGGAALAADLGCALCCAAAQKQHEPQGGDDAVHAALHAVTSVLCQGVQTELAEAQECLQEVLPTELRDAAATGSLGSAGAALVAWGAFFGAEEAAQQWASHLAARLQAGGSDLPAPSAGECRAAERVVDAALTTAQSNVWLRGCWGDRVPADSYADHSTVGGAPATISLLLRVTAPAGCTGSVAAAALQHALHSAAAAAAGGGDHGVEVEVAAVAAALESSNQHGDGSDNDTLMPPYGDGHAAVDADPTGGEVQHGVALRVTCGDTFTCLQLALLALKGHRGGLGEGVPLPRVCVRVLDAHPAVLHAEICRHVVVPHLVLRAAAAEACTLGSLTRTLAAVADPCTRLARLCDAETLVTVLATARRLGVDAADKSDDAGA